ncbi:MAG TPA: hypothetical protein VJ570_09800 [Holophagaceae bacterium]|nr:hypothetical protein [Holophagaceae bacterium]
MRGRPDCPHCQGSGFLLDPDPMRPARICPCSREVRPELATLQLPARYREAVFTSFWKWWSKEYAPNQVSRILGGMEELKAALAAPPEVAGEMPQRDRLERLLAAAEKNLEHGIRPLGAEDLHAWATKGRHRFRGGWELWWIHGPVQSGKTTLAAAALKAWGERTGQAGRFVSVRTLSQQVKNTYFDTRSWQNQDFMSVRDLLDPLKDQPLLLLDEWDCLDPDSRVANAFGELLTHRYHESLPTILTSVPHPESLAQRDNYAFARLGDASLLKRLEGADRVEMIPALAWWLDRL